MFKTAFNSTARPDYLIAQIPPGGQRGYASVLLLEYFEERTGIPTRFLFPHITASSVGVLIAAPLYLPHPEDPTTARMTARQMAAVFPKVSSNLPKRPAYLHRENDRKPLEQAVYPYIGEAKLSDLLGTLYFSTHDIGQVGNSYKIYAKKIHPVTKEISYEGNPDEKIMDIAMSSTAIPSVFPSYNKQIDLAFAETPAPALIDMKQQHPASLQGAFIRIGNFRESSGKHHIALIASGAVKQTLKSAINRAISDNSYSLTIQTAHSLFGKNCVFNLEQEINPASKDLPRVSAIASTPEQFEKTRQMMKTYIHNNEKLLNYLAETAANIARRNFPDENLSIVEYDIPATATDAPKKKRTLSFRKAAAEHPQPKVL